MQYMCMQVVSTYASATASTTCITYHGHRCTLRQLLQHLKIATSDQDGSLTSTVCNDDLAYSKVQLLKPVLKDTHLTLLAMLIMLMETIHMTFDAIVIEQLPAMTGVLCQNDCCILEYFESSYTQVFKVAYWGAN
jgi:hypothetical protein